MGSQVIRVDGLQELNARLQQIAFVMTDKDAQHAVSNALRKSMTVVRNTAQNIVHVKSGTLKENIIVTKKKNPSPGEIEMDVTVRFKAKAYVNNKANRRTQRVGATYKDYGPLYYGMFLEFGTYRTPKYPFMAPAWDQNVGALPDIFKEELVKAINDIAGGS